MKKSASNQLSLATTPILGQAPRTTPVSTQTALARAISITDEILQVLDDEDFVRVGELESKRKPFIERAFSASVEDIDVIRARHLQNLNQQVVEQLESFRQSVLDQQAQARAASKATRAYNSNLK